MSKFFLVTVDDSIANVNKDGCCLMVVDNKQVKGKIKEVKLEPNEETVRCVIEFPAKKINGG